MKRILLTAIAVACMCTLHAERTQTGNCVLSNRSVNIVDFSSPFAAADGNWVLKSSVEKDGVTKEVFVIESEFGEIKNSKTVWKRSNGDKIVTLLRGTTPRVALMVKRPKTKD